MCSRFRRIRPPVFFLTGGAERGHVLLELWGTANLELFDPTSLIRSSQATLLVAPVDDEKMVQTIESGGRRRIRLFLRRRWSIRSVIPRAGDLAVERFSVSVFQPQTGKWNTTAIPGIELPGLQMDIELPAEPGPVPPAARKSYPWRWPTIIALAALCASAWLIFGNPQLRLRSLFIRIFSRISRIRFSKP
jgi:hypothetical protein